MREKWESVLGYEQTYQISTLGRVRRIASGPGAQVGRILKQFLRGRNKKKYLCVTLSQKNEKPKKQQVHRLILEALVGPCPSGMECRHLDGNAYNNKLSNLKWGTSQENSNDTIQHEKVACGISLPQTKLNNSKVNQIRQLYATRQWTHRQLAKRFNISHYAIWRIVTRKTWKHIR